MSQDSHDSVTDISSRLVARSAIGGALMGLANLVPGISGGTMLLATGVYPGFISAIAEVSTLRFRKRSLITLGTVVATAAVAILLLAGTLKSLVEDHRWVMYSLFIGLTLGGLPLVWRLARPLTPGVALGACGAFALMVVMATGTGGGGDGEASILLTFVAGLAASSAMILPGISGGYLLLLLGMYEPILGTVDQIKVGLIGDAGFDFALLLNAMRVVIPLGIGVLAGVVGVSNLLRWLLARYAKATLGALLGLLLGAVVGLWPFQEGRAPEPGDIIKGRVVTLQNAADFPPKHWPVQRFEPATGQLGASLGLIVSGLVATLLVGRLGGDADSEEGGETLLD